MYVLAAASESTTGWAIGYTIAIVVVLVVVALVVPILLLAHSIGKRGRSRSTTRCTEAVHNTAALTRAEHDERARRRHRRRARRGRDQAGRLTMTSCSH